MDCFDLFRVAIFIDSVYCQVLFQKSLFSNFEQTVIKCYNPNINTTLSLLKNVKLKQQSFKAFEVGKGKLWFVKE